MLYKKLYLREYRRYLGRPSKNLRLRERKIPEAESLSAILVAAVSGLSVAFVITVLCWKVWHAFHFTTPSSQVNYITKYDGLWRNF